MKKGTERVAAGIIIAVILVGIMAFVYFGFLNTAFFSGGEYKASAAIYDGIEMGCLELQPGESTEMRVYFPDSKGKDKLNMNYFYISIINKDDELRLNSRRVSGDALLDFYEWIRGIPDHKTLKTYKFDYCKGTEICGRYESGGKTITTCNSFAFESDDGKEILKLKFTRDEYEDKLWIDLEKLSKL